MASAVSPLTCGAVWENRTAAAEANQFNKVNGTAESRALRLRRPSVFLGFPLVHVAVGGGILDGHDLLSHREL
jgi:hypothetical protein